VGVTDVGARPLRELVDARREEIRAIVARHHGRSVAVFGSVARGDEGPGSDIDFLVELAPDARPFEILAIGAELEEALGVKVDVGTPDSLRERLRGEVLAEAVPL
jgi:uncharacterized protein